MNVATETKARHHGSIAVRGGLRDFALALLVIVLLGCVIFFTVWRRVAFIEMGYQIRQLESAESALLRMQHELEIERAMLTSPERIEKVAREKFGFKEPEPGHIRILP